MKVREIRKVKPEWVAGWLCVDGKPGDGGPPITFFQDKPERWSDGAWTSRNGSSDTWTSRQWKAIYGKARLPKPRKCERVRLEL